jgi:hypothetical protein
MPLGSLQAWNSDAGAYMQGTLSIYQTYPMVDAAATIVQKDIIDAIEADAGN